MYLRSQHLGKRRTQRAADVDDHPPALPFRVATLLNPTADLPNIPTSVTTSPVRIAAAANGSPLCSFDTSNHLPRNGPSCSLLLLHPPAARRPLAKPPLRPKPPTDLPSAPSSRPITSHAMVLPARYPLSILQLLAALLPISHVRQLPSEEAERPEEKEVSDQARRKRMAQWSGITFGAALSLPNARRLPLPVPQEGDKCRKTWRRGMYLLQKNSCLPRRSHVLGDDTSCAPLAPPASPPPRVVLPIRPPPAASARRRGRSPIWSTAVLLSPGGVEVEGEKSGMEVGHRGAQEEREEDASSLVLSRLGLTPAYQVSVDKRVIGSRREAAWATDVESKQIS
ncbi:hypothetical protein CVT26_008498 [Gymnopilus dilepis]|uniref:Uncharacterized protein n=1 Tax=Gymnopilus dilepis TaxID=231916 RepID=A0A409YRU6_9AGAR|nr:hypothetical protein CVT26_008498 [Gymnopilus dilepis]